MTEQQIEDLRDIYNDLEAIAYDIEGNELNTKLNQALWAIEEVINQADK